jgi:hypothetical protein
MKHDRAYTVKNSKDEAEKVKIWTYFPIFSSRYKQADV